MTRYELLDRIGVGGMAEIFRGKAVAAGGFEKPVAIKRILPHLSPAVADGEGGGRAEAAAERALEKSGDLLHLRSILARRAARQGAGRPAGAAC